MQTVNLNVSNVEAMISFIKTLYPWKRIEENGTLKLWINDYTCIYGNGNTLNVGYRGTDINNGNYVGDITVYYDSNWLAVVSREHEYAIAVGITTDFDGVENNGLVSSENGTLYAYFNVNNDITRFNQLYQSIQQTQLVPICCLKNNDRFTDIYRVNIDTAQYRHGVSTLNGEQYLFAKGIAIPIS